MKSASTLTRPAHLRLVPGEPHPFDVELHPEWCDARGCGVHIAEQAVVPATAGGFAAVDSGVEFPCFEVAASMVGHDGLRAVHLYIKSPLTPGPRGGDALLDAELTLDAAEAFNTALTAAICGQTGSPIAATSSYGDQTVTALAVVPSGNDVEVTAVNGDHTLIVEMRIGEAAELIAAMSATIALLSAPTSFWSHADRGTQLTATGWPT